MDIVSVIIENCKNLSIALLVFSVNVVASALVSFNQEQAVTIKNQAQLAEKFRKNACWLFVGGVFAVLLGVFTYVFMKLSGQNWITAAYTLGILGGSLLIWSNKLKAADYKEWAIRKQRLATFLVVTGIILGGAFMLLAYLRALGMV